MLPRVLRVFGLPEGQPTTFYRDFLLAFPAAVAMLVAVVFVGTGQIGKGFWIAATVLTLAVMAATVKTVVLACATLIVACRFGFAFLVSFRFEALLGTAVFGLATLLLARWATRETGNPWATDSRELRR